MKKLKKFLAMIISMVMVLSMATASFAETGGTGSLTVTLANDNKLAENNKYTVKLYKLLNLESYDTVGNKYSYTLNKQYTQTIKEALNKKDIEDNKVVGEIANLGQDHDPAVQNFANRFEELWGEKAADRTAEIMSPDNSITINDLATGYYLIILDNARQVQANLTTVIKGTNTVKLKEEAPSITKKADKDDVEIGEIVTYTITTKIPKKFSETMVYKITDTLTEGLDFVDFNNTNNIVTQNNLEIDAKLKEKNTENYTPITEIEASVNGRTMTINLAKYIKDNQTKIGQEIRIQYKAKVNTNAVIKTNNSAKLEYGKDTSSTITNKPEEAKTPTFPVHINKTDGKNPLAGAEFEIYHSNSNGDATEGAAIKVSGSNGIYKIDPAGSETKMITVTDISGINFGKEGGYNLVINGLKAGTYWLKETKAPDGYNKINGDIKITVANNKNESYTITTGQNATVDNNIIKIVNRAGAHLPETGGTGTILLTAVGALLVAIAMIRFMRRKQEN